MEDYSDNKDSSDHEQSLPLSSLASRATGYSSDSFESISDESSFKYESEMFESLSSESENDQISQFETTNIVPRRTKDTNETQPTGEGLIEKWIITLKDCRSRTNAHETACNSKNVSVADEANTVHEMASKEENALAAFCTKKLKQLRHPPVKLEQNQTHSAIILTKQVAGDLHCPIPIQLFNRLLLKNTKENVKQLIQIEMHQPSTCPYCCAVQAELTKNTFLRKTKAKLESHLLENKIKDTIYSNDIVTLIGEIHHSLPRLSVESNIIVQKLLVSSRRTLEDTVIS